jgi:hypothetical protein
VGNAQDKLVFRRGSNFLPYWETEKGKWFLDEAIPHDAHGIFKNVIFISCEADQPLKIKISNSRL